MSAAVAFLHIVKGHLRRSGADSSWKSVAACIGATKQTVSNVLCGQHAASIETLGKWAGKVKGAGGRPIAAIVVYDGITRIMLDMKGANVEQMMSPFTGTVGYVSEGMVDLMCCGELGRFPLERGYGACRKCGTKYDTAGREVISVPSAPICDNCGNEIHSAAPHHEAGMCETCGTRWSRQ